jgi:lipoprotein-anchoring transpeptidase ErfK/SrfK
MHYCTVAAALTTALLLATVPQAHAEVIVTIDKSAQRMLVSVDGFERYTWPVSTGLSGGPPVGSYHPERLENSWYSHKFGMSPMPHSIFFHNGYAIHGTIHVSRLGHRASHGCVRLLPTNAAILFSLVEKEGLANTRIVVEH